MLLQTVRNLKDFLMSSLGLLVLILVVLLGITKLTQAGEAPVHGGKGGEMAAAGNLEPLIKTLEDPKQREDLIAKIKALQTATPKQEPPKGTLDSFISTMTERSMQLTDFVINVIPSLEKIPGQFISFFEKFMSQHAKGLLGSLILLGLALLTGLACEKCLRLLFSDLHKKSVLGSANSVVGKHAFLLTQLLVVLLPVFLFYVVSVAFVYTAHTYMARVPVEGFKEVSDGLSLAILHVLLSIFVFRAVVSAAHLFFSPKGHENRYLKLTDQKAHHLFMYIRNMIGFAAIGFAISNVADVLGLEPEPHILWSRMVGFVTAVMSISLIFHYRLDVAEWIRDEIEKNDSRSRSIRELLTFLSDIWHLLATAAVVGIFLMWSLNPETGHTHLVRCVTYTVAVFMIMRLCHYAVVKLIRAASKGQSTVTKEGQMPTTPMPHLDSLLHGLIHITAFGVILHVWGIDLLALAKTKAGETIVGHGIAVITVLVLAVMVWEVINRLITDELTPVTIDGKVMKASTRAMTFLPIVRKIAKWAIILFSSVVVLAEFGLNVTALLAGLGVIGLAVAMGSQKLAQDVVTGAFILVENSLEVGDVVNVGGVNGEVVDFSIRTIVIRNISGELHTVPYSAIGTVSNLSKDYSNCIMEISVGHDASIVAVTSLFEKIGAEMYADQSLSPRLLSELKVIGVSKMTDTSTSIMSIMKTEPDPYHLVDQEFRRRLKLKFAELGIPVPAVRQVVSIQANSPKQPAFRVALETAAK